MEYRIRLGGGGNVIYSLLFNQLAVDTEYYTGYDHQLVISIYYRGNTLLNYTTLV